MKGMKNLLDKAAIIKLKEQGLSNRAIARTLKIDKKTVNKYWNKHKENLKKLESSKNETEIAEIQETTTYCFRFFVRVSVIILSAKSMSLILMFITVDTRFPVARK